jgi:phosphoribosylglycinamide formyltransferase 1
MANITVNYPRVLVMASGAGSTFAALAGAAASGRLHAHIVGLITDRKAAALDRAAEVGIERLVVEYRKGDEAWPSRLRAAAQSFRPDYIILAGFLRRIPQAIVQEYKGRIFNSHPALLPKYGGAGMYGSKVHQAVVAAGDKESGITLHHVTENYDEGAAIAQLRIALEKGETAQSLEERLKVLEKEFLISELQNIFSKHDNAKGG